MYRQRNMTRTYLHIYSKPYIRVISCIEKRKRRRSREKSQISINCIAIELCLIDNGLVMDYQTICSKTFTNPLIFTDRICIFFSFLNEASVRKRGDIYFVKIYFHVNLFRSIHMKSASELCIFVSIYRSQSHCCNNIKIIEKQYFFCIFFTFE